MLTRDRGDRESRQRPLLFFVTKTSSLPRSLMKAHEEIVVKPIAAFR